jgi:hypothetical protein
MNWPFRESDYNNLEPYFQSLREYMFDSPIGLQGLINLQEITSRLNRFHTGQPEETIVRVLYRNFGEDEYEKAAAIEIILGACNEWVSKKHKGAIKSIDIYQKGGSKNFQSLAEALSGAVNARILSQSK